MVAFACFHGVNIPMVADSMLTVGHPAWSMVRHHEHPSQLQPLRPSGTSGVAAGHVTLFCHLSLACPGDYSRWLQSELLLGLQSPTLRVLGGPAIHVPDLLCS